MRQLMAAGIGESFDAQKTFLAHLVMQFGAGHGVSERNLDGFAIQFLGEVDGLVDGFLGFTGQADDEVAVNFDADLAAILHEFAGHFDGGALFDVLENLRVAGFEAHDEQAGSAVGHSLQLFVLAVAAGGAGPLKFQRLEFLAQFNGTILTDVEGIVIEENFLHLREVTDGVFNFLDNVVDGTYAPGVAGDGLRPHTESAKGRATARSVEGDERIQEKRNIVIFDLQIALVDVCSERERVELGSLQVRALRIVDVFSVFAVAGAGNLFQRLAVSEFCDRVIELAAHHEIDVHAGVKGFVRPDVTVRANEGNFQGGIGFLDFAKQLHVAVEADGGGIENQEFIVFADVHGLLPVDLVRGGIKQTAAGD